MAALFGGGRSKGKSSSEIKYTELPQHLSEDEDELCNTEDDLLFVASSTNGLQNGSAASRTKKNGRYRQGEVIELGNLGGSPIKRARLHPAVEVRQAAFARKCLFICSIFVVGVIVIALAVGLPGWNVHVSKNTTWTVLFDKYGTESCIRLHDLDGDGLLDVVVGMGIAEGLLSGDEREFEDYCTQHGKQYPCVGLFLGIRGTDGQELWRVATDSGTFLSDCEHIDVNQDGTTDCIATGRQGTVAALNAKTGENLWTADRKYLKRQWNTYQVAPLPDFDEDGVPEILIPHGGEPRFNPEEHDRNPGRLLVLSGRTGQSVGRYLDMPDSKETYMSSVIYTAPDKSQYILFGSGGETVPGDFMAISMEDFRRHVMNTAEDKTSTNRTYSHWKNKPRDKDGIITIFRGKTNGVMVPPVIVDVNGDGVNDILMTAFEGQMVLFDGRTLEPMWTVNFTGCQTYSTPAPGYFDGDDHPDFMTSWNNGTWPDYHYSMLVVVSGADGSVLWKTYSQEYNMASPLSLVTSRYHQDVFLYQIVGRTGPRVNDINGAIHGLGAQRNLSRRHAGREDFPNGPPVNKHPLPKHGRKNGRLHEMVNPSLKDKNQPAKSKAKPLENPGPSRETTVNEPEKSPKIDNSPPEDAPVAGGSDMGGKGHLTCDTPMLSLRSEIFLMDRTTMTAPVLAWHRDAEIYNYTLTDEDRQRILRSMNEHREPGERLTELTESARNNTLGEFCTVMSASVLTTGAVGDVDGDGQLDYIALDGMVGLIKDREGSYVRMEARTYISKVNLAEQVRRFKTVQMKTFGVLQHTGTSGERFHFLGDTEQKWTQYLGKYGNGVYN